MQVFIHTHEPQFVEEVLSLGLAGARWIATERWLHRVVAVARVDAVILDARLDAAAMRCAQLGAICAAPILAVAATDMLDEHVALLRGGATTVLRRPFAADLLAHLQRRGARPTLADNWHPQWAQLDHHDAQLLAILRAHRGQVVPPHALSAALPACGSLDRSIAHLSQSLLQMNSMIQIEVRRGGYRLARRTLN